MATEEVALQHLRELLPKVDLQAETTNTLLKRVSEELGQDVSAHKKVLKEAINDYLLSHPENEDEKPADDNVEDDEDAPKVEGAALTIELGTLLLLTVKTFKGKASVDIRKYFQEEESQELKPTRKGISLTVPQWKLLAASAAELYKALDDNEREFTVALGNDRAATVTDFRGTLYIDIREFYKKEDGKHYPGPKGSMLDYMSFHVIMDNIKRVNNVLKDLGSNAPAEPAAKKIKTDQGAVATSSKPGPAKKADPKVNPKAESKAEPKAKNDSMSDSGQAVIEMGNDKRATISEFKGRKLVDLRAWYQKDGELKPGAKGISLASDMWQKLCELAPKLTAALQKGDDKCSHTLGGMKKVSVSLFGGKAYVNVREYYEKGGETCPGKKGLAMNADQWSKLVEGMDSINKQL